MRAVRFVVVVIVIALVLSFIVRMFDGAASDLALGTIVWAGALAAAIVDALANRPAARAGKS